MAYDDSAYRGGNGVEATGGPSRSDETGSSSRYEETGNASRYDGTSQYDRSQYEGQAQYEESRSSSRYDDSEDSSRFEESSYRGERSYRGDTSYPGDTRYTDRTSYQDETSYRDDTRYDSSYRKSSRYRETAGYRGSGDTSGYSTVRYRDETSGYGSAGYSSGGIATGDYTDPDPYESTPRQPLSAAELDAIFDDPAHGERGRDRLGVHLLWELVLLAAVAGVGYLIHREFPEAIRRPDVDTLLVFATGLGLLAMGAGLTLRAAVPNLALGPVAVASALHFAENGDNGVVPVVLTAAGAAALLGLAVAIVVLGAHVPAWAGSLAAACAVIVFIQQRSAPVEIQGGYDPIPHALYLVSGFVTLALIGASFGAFKGIRRAVGRMRPIGDPADRRGGMAVALSGSAIVVSMTFAAVAGVLLAASSSNPVTPTPGLEWTGLAFGAALVAGTSAFGRRGGIFGTVAAVALLVLVIRYTDLRGWNISLYAFAAGAIGLGLLVTRLVERYGRPRVVVPEGRNREWRREPARPTWGTTRREHPESSWSSVLPAQRTGEQTEAWDTSRWTSAGR